MELSKETKMELLKDCTVEELRAAADAKDLPATVNRLGNFTNMNGNVITLRMEGDDHLCFYKDGVRVVAGNLTGGTIRAFADRVDEIARLMGQ